MQQKNYLLRLFIFFIIFLAVVLPYQLALAQQQEGTSVIYSPTQQTPNKADTQGPAIAKPSTTHKPSAQTEQIMKKASSVIDHQDDLVLISNAQNYKLDENIVFIRVDGKRFEIISRGKVKTIQGTQAYVEMDRQSLMKFPLKGDVVIKLGEPWRPPVEVYPEPPSINVQAEEPPEPGDPGYIEIKGGQFFSSLASDNTTDANKYKSVGAYQFPYYSMTWFHEYAWRLGFEYEKINGDYPTFTYYHDVYATKENFSRLIINYRSRLMWNNLFRATARLGFLRNGFYTDNPDEGVISSDISAPGFGGKFHLEFAPANWKDESGPFKFKFQQAYYELMIYPMLAVSDGGASRGTSSGGSTGYEMRFGADMLIYLRWFPWFKRWLINAEYGEQIFNIKMSGATQKAADGVYTIPEGGSYKEIRRFYFLNIGWRWDDFIGKFFKPR